MHSHSFCKLSYFIIELVRWCASAKDSLIYFENYKHSTAGKLSKEALMIFSIVRQVEYENLILKRVFPSVVNELGEDYHCICQTNMR